MNPKNLDQLAGWLALAAGALDFCTGLGLVVAPALLLRLMGMGETFGDMVYLRFVGAFVWAVGFSYLWALRRRQLTGDATLLRATLEITIIFRLAAGSFAAWAILRGWLMPAWASVPATDFFLAATQGWLLRRGALAQKK
jgi:uncharacterized protein YjeT (DUF2065 family)